MRPRLPASSLALSLSLLAVGCGGADKDKRDAAAEQPRAKDLPARPATNAAAAPPSAADAKWTWKIPKGLGTPPVVPADNPMTSAKVELGHQLFMDKRLSVDGTRSCYSCHQNHLGNADGRPKALGPAGKALTRNTLTIWNVGYHPALYWDGRAANLEAQGIGALKGGNMGLGDGLEAKMAEIGALPEYAAAFADVFGVREGQTVTSEHISKALSAYERTLLCGDTGWDTQVMSEAAARGARVFTDKGSCIGCHNGPAMSDGLLHVTGVAVDPKDEGSDVGAFAQTKNPVDKYKFRTPTLRNITKTAPYFHDGSSTDLEEVVRIMGAGGRPQAGLTIDPLLLDRHLTDAEVKDVVAFLGALECPGELKVIGDQDVEGIATPSDAGADQH